MSARDFGNELLQRLLSHAVERLPGALGAGLSLASSVGSTVAPRSVAAVGVADQLDPALWASGSGPLWDAFRMEAVIVRPDPERAGQPDLDGASASAGTRETSPSATNVLGLVDIDSVPAKVLASVRGAVFSAGEFAGELPVVLSVYFDRIPDRELVEQVDEHEALLSSALAAVEYCAGEEVRAEQMLEMTQYRRVIEQAKGLVIGATGVDAAEAFATLSRASQHFNVRLRHLTVAMVEHVSGAGAEQPDDPELVVRPTANDREVAAKVWAALTAGPILAGTTGPVPGAR